MLFNCIQLYYGAIMNWPSSKKNAIMGKRSSIQSTVSKLKRKRGRKTICIKSIPLTKHLIQLHIVTNQRKIISYPVNQTVD